MPLPLVCLFLLVGTSGLELPSEDRIVDGAPINITDVPYMLSYMVDGNHACGAAIIDKEWGLTAAHCVIPFVGTTDSISVRSGSNTYDSGGTVHNVTQLIYHEKYNDSTNEYDIAVLKVDPPFEFSNTTKPVKLPENRASVDTKWGLVAGWGYFIEWDPILSNTLQYVIVPKVKWETCADEYKDRYDLTPYQVCYGFEQGGKDSCKGDSGGPLVNINHTIIGITSWGSGCGESYSPGVYTDVIGLIDWIKHKISN
ncbi:vitellin-degrading protease isoform X1 [Megachile rotundata]|uniref:vitellin-degrading protease isoform X1 n=1 Tax=Megachile rotundata TaxID=143995 RepID=UPI003FD19050